MKRLFAILMIACLLLPMAGIGEIAYGQDTGKKYVTVCIEKKTLGQGFLIEPTQVEIYEDDTAASVLVRLLEDEGYEYRCTGSVEGGDFYLQSIKDADNGTLDIPSFITENGGPSNDDNEGNDDDYLGEFDYSFMSGWMITVNNVMIPVGSAQWPVYDGDCIRWQFTLWGYGADLGCDTGWGDPSYYTEPNRGDLLTQIARVRADEGNFIETHAGLYQAVYDTALEIEATQEDLNEATHALVKAYEQYLDPATPTPKPSVGTVKELPYSIDDAVNKVSEFMLDTVTNPECGSIGGEWAVLELARSGKITEQFKKTYLDNLKTYVQEKNGVLHSVKLTEYSRVIIALSALGEDPTTFAGYNLVKPLANREKTVKQGINGAIYALIALDSGNYEIPVLEGSGTQTTRENLVQYILDKELSDGGWTLSGAVPDPDITMMAIQGLARYYTSNEKVKVAVDRGLDVISKQQRDDGGLASWGSVNSESVAQTICALCALNIDPATDARFIKEHGAWLLSSLFSFMVENDGTISFAHVGNDSNQMATEQAAYALVAYNRLLQKKTGLYDMSDVTKSENSSIASNEATIALPSNINNQVGTQFNISLRLGSIAEATALIDGILTYSSNLDVVSVTADDTILGGSLNWNAENGTLRFVYMDILNGNEIMSTQEGTQDFLHITFKIREKAPEGSNLYVSLASLRQMKDSETIVEYLDKETIHEITLNDINVSTTVLYQGDGTDWIPADKKAVKVVFTGLENKEHALGFQANGGYSMLYKSNDFTSYAGVTTYIMIVDSSVTDQQLSDSSNYSVYDSQSIETISFADTNEDNAIDAQDALNMVSLWLRKSTPEVTSKLILTYNVSGDAKIDSIDALSVVEYYIMGKPFAIRLK